MHSFIAFLLFHLPVALWQDPGLHPPSPHAGVLVVRLENEPITPVTARFVRRALEQAAGQQPQCLVILLDTPGGLIEPTREIVKEILQSEVPVVVYVAPTGSRAASAGVFITLASHIAAMTPGTNIGAAHPVQIGGTPVPSPQSPPTGRDKDRNKPETGQLDEKIVNDTAAWARALAELRGRNAEWSARSVRESISASASEALNAGVVEVVAVDLTDLLKKIDGRVLTVRNKMLRLDLAGAKVHEFDKWWGERFLSAIANPNIAFLLLMLGFYGILFELYTPGLGVAGIVGAISIVLAFFALAVLPINVVGLALILIAFGLFVAEGFLVSYGALTAGGIACLIVGGLMLVDEPFGFPGVSLTVLIPISLATAAIGAFLLGKVIQSHRSTVQSGSEAMLGERAVVQDDFQPHASGDHDGFVIIRGEIWRAISAVPLAAGQGVSVTGRDGLILKVEPDHSARYQHSKRPARRIA